MNTRWLLMLVFFFQLKSLSADNTKLPDSIVTIEHTYHYIIADPDKAQQIMDELLRRKTDKAWELDWCQGDLYYNTGKYRLAQYYFERVADYVEVNSNHDLMTGLLSTMMECYRMNNDMEMTLKTAIELQKLAQETGNKAEIGRAYQFMGIATLKQFEYKRADAFFALAEKNLNESGMAEYIYHFHLTSANILTEEKKFDEAYRHVQKAIEALSAVAGDSAPLPDNQIRYEQGRIHALAAEIAIKSGRQREAQHHYNVFRTSPCTSDDRGQIYIVPYLLKTGNYDRAIDITQKRITFLRSHTNAEGDDLIAALNYLQKAYEEKGDFNNALLQSKELASELKKMIEDDRKHSTLELSVIYDVHQKESLIASQKSALEKHKTWLFVSAIFIILSIIVITLIIQKVRFTKRANRSMVKQIKEMQQYKGSVGQLREDGECDNLKSDECARLLGVKDERLRDEHFFQTMDKRIREENLFLNPQFTRDDAIQLFNVKKDDLIYTVNHYTGMNFSDYINSIRLEVALKLLETTNDNIEVVAEKSGFGSSRSLYRQFNQKYSMPPSTYRKIQASLHQSPLHEKHESNI